MSTQDHHTDRRPARAVRGLVIAATILMCLGIAGCTATPLAPSASTTPLGPSATAPEAAVTLLPLYEVELEAGTYTYQGFTVPLEVTVPDGWTWRAEFPAAVLRKDVGDTTGVFVHFSMPKYVPGEACQWKAAINPVGPSADEFAAAMAAQTSTTTTTPVDLTIGDYHAVEFGFSVDSGLDLADCFEEKICVHAEAQYHCSRYYQSTTQRETYRVVDLDDGRAVMTVGEFDDQTSAALVEEAQAVFDSITFSSPY